MVCLPPVVELLLLKNTRWLSQRELHQNYHGEKTAIHFVFVGVVENRSIDRSPNKYLATDDYFSLIKPVLTSAVGANSQTGKQEGVQCDHQMVCLPDWIITALGHP